MIIIKIFLFILLFIFICILIFLIVDYIGDCKMQWKELYLILERVNKVEDTDHARIGFLICEIDILHRGTRNKKIKVKMRVSNKI